jgi:hypothetical protein
MGNCIAREKPGLRPQRSGLDAGRSGRAGEIGKNIRETAGYVPT